MTIVDYKYFKKVHSQFSLGNLTTESFHPLTDNLSFFCKKDLNKAIDILKDVDLQALEKLKIYKNEFLDLQIKIKKYLENKQRVFLVGCGATGRLSLALERYFIESLNGDSTLIVSLMAGGDVALIHSIEDFEDSEEYANRTLADHDFSSDDLMIAITEGGETPYVLASAQYARNMGANSYCLFCNSLDQLSNLNNRTNKLLTEDSIKKISLDIGPQAISGSTRMQASTALMLFVGLAFTECDYLKELSKIINCYKGLDISKIAKFVELESDIYKENGFVNYIADSHCAIHVLTDTTERAPTFSLNPFESINSYEKRSLCYLFVEHVENAEDAWYSILGRAPRCLEWDETKDRTSINRFLKFDISGRKLKRPKNSYKFIIKSYDHSLKFSFHDLILQYDGFHNDLSMFICLKMLLNTHSTLVMGRLDRYESNVMTYVRPSNLKLIDRVYRYVKEIMEQKNQFSSDDEILKTIFELKKSIKIDEPIVIKVVEKLSSRA